MGNVLNVSLLSYREPHVVGTIRIHSTHNLTYM